MRRPLVVAVLLGVVPFVGGGALRNVDWTTPIGAPISVRLLQGNIAQDMKFRVDQLDAQLRIYFDMAVQAPADLVVMPETAMPVFPSMAPSDWFEQLSVWSREHQAAIVFGLPFVQQGAGGEYAYTNSASAITPTLGWTDDGHAAPRYDKHHLVPCGEFIPPGFRWFVNAMNMPLGDFTRGSANQPTFAVAGQHIAINICYEDLFGAQIANPVRRPPVSEPATILMNLSNIAWFGDSAALPQHLLASRMRAIETGRPMLRATNTGMTAAIAPNGAVLARLAPFTRGVLTARVQGMQGQTPYVRYGDWPMLIVLGAGLLALVLRMRLRG